MGYTTDFSGQINIVPPLNEHEIEYLREFSRTRHMGYIGGPYVTDKVTLATGGTIPGGQNTPTDGQPGLWCQWEPAADGTALKWNGSEKFYGSVEWMRYLIDTFLSSEAMVRQEIAWGTPRREGRYYPAAFNAFTFDHVLNGTIEAQGEETSDHWWLLVTDNTVREVPLADLIKDSASVIRGFLDSSKTITTVTEETEFVIRGTGVPPDTIKDYLDNVFPIDPANPFADDYAAVMRAEAAAAVDDDIPGATEREALRKELLANGGVKHGGIVFVSPEARDEFYAMLADDGPSYADKVNAPIPDAVAHEIGRQIKSGDYPRYIRSAPRQWTQNEALAEKMLANGGVEDGGITFVSPEARDKFYAAMNNPAFDDTPEDDADSVFATLDAAVADGTAGTTVAPPAGFGFIECTDIEGSLFSDSENITGGWTEDDEDDAEFNPNLMFYIWSNRHQLYWGPNRKGYVVHPSQAGQYTADEASAIVAHSMRGVNLGYNHALPDSIMLPVVDQ